MKRLQIEHAEWLRREYPNQPLEHPAAGMVEEAAELLHCVLKLEQENKFGPHPRFPNKELKRKLVDAIGDCAIYCCSYCNTAHIEFQEITGVCASVASLPKLVKACSVVTAAVNILHVRENEDSTHLLKSYMSNLLGVADAYNIDFVLAVQTTWAEVKLRKRKPDKLICPLCARGTTVTELSHYVKADIGVGFYCDVHGQKMIRFVNMDDHDRRCLCLE